MGLQVLLAPAADLACKIIAGLAESLQAHCLRLDQMQIGDHTVHLCIDLSALGQAHARQRLIHEHTALQKRHHVKRRAHDRLIIGVQKHLRHRHGRILQSLHDPILSIHRMGGGEQGTGRFFAKDVSIRV